jgi:hypothetical protein
MSTSYVAYKVFDDVLKEIPHYIIKNFVWQSQKPG